MSRGFLWYAVRIGFILTILFFIMGLMNDTVGRLMFIFAIFTAIVSGISLSKERSRFVSTVLIISIVLFFVMTIILWFKTPIA